MAFKVRVALPGALLHLASSTEPVVEHDEAGRLVAVRADWLNGQGDTVGHINWPSVLAVTWREAQA